MSYMINLFHLYAGNGTVMALYLIAWLLIVLLERRKSHKTAFAFSAWYLPLVILNPLAGMLLERFQILPERIVRLYWLLPVFPVIAYGFTLLIQRAEEKRHAGVCTTAIISLLIILTGKSVMSNDSFVKAENLYKLPDGVIEIVDLINEDAAKYEEGGEEAANRKSVLPMELSTYARQYDGTLLLLYGRYPTDDNDREVEACNLMLGQTIPVDRVAELAKEENCRYLVLDSGKEWENMPGEEVLTLIGSYADYCLYRLN